MALIKGGALRLFQTGLYAIIFLASAVILGFYSYFLSVLADRKEHIPQWEKAVEGISGAACLYLIFAVLLTCCLGGVSVLAFIAIVLDLLFFGGMLAIAVMTRHGATSCKGKVNTPLGTGQANSSTGGFGSNGFGEGSSGNSNVVYSVHLGLACNYNTASFACSLIAAFLFLCTAALQVALVRHHKKEKQFGPSPKNNYTSGPGKKGGIFSFRKNKQNKKTEREAEMGAAGVGAGTLAAGHHHDMRPSHETAMTGTTVGAGNNASTYDKVESGHQGHLPHGTHGGYYTQPQGTGVNPYGYENNATTHNTATNY